MADERNYQGFGGSENLIEDGKYLEAVRELRRTFGCDLPRALEILIRTADRIGVVLPANFRGSWEIRIEKSRAKRRARLGTDAGGQCAPGTILFGKGG